MSTEQILPQLQTLIDRAGFSTTYERVRLERLIWFTLLDISPLLTEEQWLTVKEQYGIPDDVRQRKNFNYLLKKTQDQPETYQD